MLLLTRLLRRQDGAAAIEAFAALGILLLLLVVVVNVGAGFWNLSVLTNTSQSATLTHQFLVDASCSPRRNGAELCQLSRQQAKTQVNFIVDNADDELLLVGSQNPCAGQGSRDSKVVSRLVTGVQNGRATLGAPQCSSDLVDSRLPSTSNLTLPNGQELSKGWGYSSIALTAPMRFWMGNLVGAGDEVTLAAGSLTATYKPVSP